MIQENKPAEPTEPTSQDHLDAEGDDAPVDATAEQPAGEPGSEAPPPAAATAESPPAAHDGASPGRENARLASDADAGRQYHSPPANDPPQRSNSHHAALWLTLINFLLVIGLAAIAYLGFQSFENQRHVQQQRLEALASSTADLDVTRQSREQWFDSLDASLSAQTQDVRKLRERAERQADEIKQLQSGLSSLAERIQGGESAWQLAEVEYLLLMANNRLHLMADVGNTIIALKLADQRLASMADPAFLPTRDAIRRELSALQAVPKVDIQAVALTLGSLIDQSHHLPLIKPAVGQFSTDLDIAELGNEGVTWYDRAWDAVQDAVGSLVSIRQDAERRTPMLPPNDELFLRQNVRLQLESARLAALLGDKANFQIALRQAEQWIARYFDRSQTATSSILRQVNELRGQEFAPTLPDISGSLKTLRALEPVE